MHEMQKGPHRHQFSTSDGQGEATAEGMLPEMSRPRDGGVAQEERVHQAAGQSPDARRAAGSSQAASAEQGNSKVRPKWYRFIYRSPLMLIGIVPPLPDQYHQLEGEPCVFANWDVKGPFDTKEEARRNGYENGYD